MSDPIENLPRHEFDMVPQEITDVFNDILRFRVDPSSSYFKEANLDKIVERIKQLNTGKVAAIASEGKEAKYQEKGHMYDPVLQAFVQGCGGRLSTWTIEEHTTTPIVLRGITKRREMAACKEAGRDFYYIDTGYFGNGKKKLYHRVTKNDVQYFGPIIDRPADRFEKTGVRVSKFRPGSKILLAPPSQKLLNLYGIDLAQWLAETQEEIRKYSDRPIVIREKQSRTVRQSSDTMEMALSQDIHCLVTFSSIAAGEALLCGKPAITLGPNAAAPLCSKRLKEIEKPKIPTIDEVRAWAAHLAYCQFTEAEMKDGTAWRILNE